MNDEIKNLENEEMEDDKITLTNEDGEDEDFYVIAGIEIDDSFYMILQPVELPEGMDEDEAIVFKVSGEEDDESFDLVEDEEILDAVFAEYEKLVAADEEE